MTTGAGVATATISQINAEAEKPTSEISSKMNVCFGSKCRMTANASRKEKSGDGSENNQPDIDRAMQSLAAAAVLALGEVRLIIGTHFGGEVGDIVTPACKNVPDYLVHALCLHSDFKT